MNSTAIQKAKKQYIPTHFFELYFDKLNHGLLVNKIGKYQSLLKIFKFTNGHFLLMFSYRDSATDKLYYRVLALKRGRSAFISDNSAYLQSEKDFSKYLEENK